MDWGTMNSLLVKTVLVVLNWSLAAIFLYLRIRGGKGPMTMSQKWALTGLSWLFILNSTSITLEYLDIYLRGSTSFDLMFYIQRIKRNVDVITGLTFLIVGLVYPRPFTNWKRLRMMLFGLFLFMFALVFLQVQIDQMMDQEMWQVMNISGVTYVLGWFLPVVLWLPLYEAESSTSGRMVLTLFIWAFMSMVFIADTGKILKIFVNLGSFTAYSFLSMMLYFYVAIRLLLILYKRRANWERPEWINIGFMCVCSFFGVLLMIFGYDANSIKNYGTLLFITNNVPWTVLRPALFVYVILKFQIFGPQFRVEKYLSFVLGVVGSMSMLVLVSYIPGLDLTVLLVLGIVVGLVLFVPFLRLADRIISEFLPLTSKEERATMLEKRATYLTSLQTAVVAGAIDLPEDEVALTQQRGLLGISQREHDLLMDSFIARESLTAKSAPMVTEVFLIHIDGRPLVHEAAKSVDGKELGPEKDSDIMAGMLTAIRDYVQEGLRMGGTARTSLDAIKYGDYALIIETEERLVLAAVVKGQDSPELRQVLRDELMIIKKRYGKDLMHWDGDLDKAEGAQKDLKSFIDVQSSKKVRTLQL
jgi:hypothetical protein